MPVRLPIPKLAAAAVSPLTVKPNFSNALLNPAANWPQDVNYLLDTYSIIYAIWNIQKDDPVQDERIYTETEPHLRELLIGLTDVSKELSTRSDIANSVTNATHDADVAGSYARAGDWGMATVYQAYAIIKMHRVLTILVQLINSSGKRSSKKLGYGYDVSGEIEEKGGTSGNDRALDDLGNSPKMDKTPPNPVSVAKDFEAEDDFPELAEKKQDRVNWPPRVR